MRRAFRMPLRSIHGGALSAKRVPSSARQGHRRPTHRPFRRHLRSDSPGPSGSGARRPAALSSRSCFFHSRRASAAQTAGELHALRASLRHGGAGLRRQSALCAFAGRMCANGAGRDGVLFRGYRAPLSEEFDEPGDRIYFIVGADSFLQIATWKDYQTLLGLCDFVVASRPGISHGALRQVIPPELWPIPRRARRKIRRARVTWSRSIALRTRRYICWTRWPATSRPQTCATGWTVADRFTGLCLRAWRNTLESRLYTGTNEQANPSPRTVRAAPSRPRRDKQARAGDAAGSRRAGRVHR